MTPEIKQRIEQIQNCDVPEGYKQTKAGIIPKDWEVMRLKDKFDRLSRKNAEGNTNVLTISAQYGLINQEEFFKKEIASDDKSNYYLLHRGEFAYNKSYSNGYPFGAIKRLSRYDKGVVSPLYICFSANNNNACPEYYEQYFEAGRLNHEIQAYAQEGARNHGLLNISVIDFFNSKIIVPPIAEQKKIAKILSAQDKVIECYEKKIEHLQLMKKYYLQNMFPKRGETVPKIRFKGFADAWEQRKITELGEIFIGLVTTMTSHYTNHGALLIRNSDIKDGRFEFGDNPIYLDYDFARQNAPRKHRAGDVITVHTGDIGTSAVITEKEDGSIGFATIVTRPNNKIIKSKYLCTYLNTDVHKAFAMNMSTGDGRNNYNLKDFYKCIVPVPSIPEQAMVSEFIEKMNNLITLHQRLRDEEKKKKKALQQLLLTGIVRL